VILTQSCYDYCWQLFIVVAPPVHQDHEAELVADCLTEVLQQSSELHVLSASLDHWSLSLQTGSKISA